MFKFYVQNPEWKGMKWGGTGKERGWDGDKAEFSTDLLISKRDTYISRLSNQPVAMDGRKRMGKKGSTSSQHLIKVLGGDVVTSIQQGKSGGNFHGTASKTTRELIKKSFGGIGRRVH